MQEVSELYGYVEYDGPFLERIDLYAAKFVPAFAKGILLPGTIYALFIYFSPMK